MNFPYKRKFNEGKQAARSSFRAGVTPQMWWAMTTSFCFDPRDPFDRGNLAACQIEMKHKTISINPP